MLVEGSEVCAYDQDGIKAKRSISVHFSATSSFRMDQLLPAIAVVVFLLTVTSAFSLVPKFDTQSDDCNWFPRISRENHIQPFDLGLSLTIYCNDEND